VGGTTRNGDGWISVVGLAVSLVCLWSSTLSAIAVLTGWLRFTEYVLYRLSQHYSTAVEMAARGPPPPFRVHGFGTTLKHPPDAPAHQFPDFDMDGFHYFARRMMPCFQTHYGADGTGDLTSVTNVRAFAHHVMDKTEHMGVDLVLADGGFELEQGQENEVEAKSFRLILAEVLAAVMTLKRGGTFVLKLFDCYLPPTVGLLHILTRLFAKVSMTKGGLSRPASPERYLVCRGLQREFDGRVVAFLAQVLDKLGEEEEKKVAREERAKAVEAAKGTLAEESEAPETGPAPEYLFDLVPRDLLIEQKPYVDWISSKNFRFALDQLMACQDLLSYIEDPEKESKAVKPDEIDEMIDRLDIPRDANKP